MRTEQEWKERAKGLLKGELKRRNVSYQDLAAKLAEIGVEENPSNIANKISRGGFSAVFMLQCLDVIGCKRVALDED